MRKIFDPREKISTHEKRIWPKRKNFNPQGKSFDAQEKKTVEGTNLEKKTRLMRPTRTRDPLNHY